MSSVVPTTALADARPVVTHRQPIECLFAPRSIAVVGASDREGSVGQVVLQNLRTGGFRGRLYAVNDKRSTVQGLISVPSVRDLPAPVDLALIAVPAARVAAVIEDCGRAGVRAALVFSAGFAESGPDGAARQAEVVRVARANRVRLIGPNCVGVVRPSANLQAFFGHTFARPGRLALVSQSGALCTAILDWAAAHEVGFSAVASVGAAADIGFGELLDYLALDTETGAILLYAEGVDHARAFMSGLRAAARMKPVIVLKAGRHAEARQAAASHTGALIGDDAVFDAALRRAGALRVGTLEELFSTAELLASGARTRGDRLAIVTNAGGLGVMAADRVAERNVVLAKLAPETLAALDAALPAHWSHGNPIDLIGDAPPERFARALDAVFRDPGVDGALVLLSPQAMTQPDEVAKHLIAKHTRAKPVLACFTGGASVHEAQAMLAHAGVPHLPSPEAAVDAFAHLANFQRNQQLLLQVPATAADGPQPDLEAARAVIAAARRERRNLLSQPESKALLAAFHVPVTACEIAQSADAAVAAAIHVGMPVAMKLHSLDVTHKSDVGGVIVGLTSEQAVREAFATIMARAAERAPKARVLGVTIEPMHGKRSGRELLAGIASDPAFGPVIAFGAGGTLVELIADRCIALPPLNAEIARSMIDRTRVRRLLGPFRGMPEVDLNAIDRVLLRLSELACELPDVSEVDINPLVADENGVVAVDARVVLREPQAGARGYAHVAIEPYPAQLTRELDIAGEHLTVRPIRPSDAAIERAFVHDLSFDSRYLRFHCGLVELTPAMLVRLTQIDYSREMAFIALRGSAGREQAVGVARYVADNDAESCEFALTVADAWQGHGVGTALMHLLIEHARGKGLSRMFGYVLAENRKMLEVARALGFDVARHEEDATLRVVTLQLDADRSSNDG